MRFVCFLSALLLVPALVAADSPGPEGDPFTMRALLDHRGVRTGLSEQASGNRLVVVVYKSAGCPVCQGQMARLRDLAGRLKRLETRAVGVADDRGTRVAKGQGPWQLLADPEQRFLRAAGLFRPGSTDPLPALLVYDRSGSLRARLEGRYPGMRVETQLMALLEDLARSPADCGEPSS
jgi:peroxiredoxin